jgi:molybdopterin converting factor small subunit
LLVSLTEAHPHLRSHLLDEAGQVRSFLRIYLEDTDIDEFEGTRTRLAPDAEVVLVPAIAGGTEIQAGPWVR